MKEQSYFQLFDLDFQYAIDKKLLDAKLFEKQREYHPDKYIHGTEELRKKVLEKSQEINYAYKILKNDFSRAEYILEQKGVNIKTQKLDQGFLMEIFEWREQLESKAELPNLQNTVTAIIDKTMHLLGYSLEKELYEQAKNEYIRLKFLKRFLEEIEKALNK